MGRERPHKRGLPSLRSADDHIHLPAAATGAHKPLAPFGNSRLGAIPLGHLGGIRFDLTAAVSTPYNQPHASGQVVQKSR
jgi:hypothetical protein